MNRRLRWAPALVLLPIAACASNPPPPPTPPAPPPLAQNDAAFVADATSIGLAEIAEAKLAQSVSKSPRIQSYAADMITDHTKANEDLAAIAAKKNVAPPTAPTAAQSQELATLQGEKGRKFDRDYINDQILGHQAALKLFQDEAAGGTDPDLKAFAQANTPVIQHHLDMATAIASPSGHHHGHHHVHKTS